MKIMTTFALAWFVGQYTTATTTTTIPTVRIYEGKKFKPDFCFVILFVFGQVGIIFSENSDRFTFHFIDMPYLRDVTWYMIEFYYWCIRSFTFLLAIKIIQVRNWISWHLLNCPICHVMCEIAFPWVKYEKSEQKYAKVLPNA